MEATCKLGTDGCWNDGKCRATSNCMHKVITNADRIRAMDDELLATQLVQVVVEAIKVLAKVEMPDSLANKIRSQFLEKLKQPAEEGTP